MITGEGAKLLFLSRGFTLGETILKVNHVFSAYHLLHVNTII